MQISNLCVSISYRHSQRRHDRPQFFILNARKAGVGESVAVSLDILKVENVADVQKPIHGKRADLEPNMPNQEEIKRRVCSRYGR